MPTRDEALAELERVFEMICRRRLLILFKPFSWRSVT